MIETPKMNIPNKDKFIQGYQFVRYLIEKQKSHTYSEAALLYRYLKNKEKKKKLLSNALN